MRRDALWHVRLEHLPHLVEREQVTKFSGTPGGYSSANIVRPSSETNASLFVENHEDVVEPGFNAAAEAIACSMPASSRMSPLSIWKTSCTGYDRAVPNVSKIRLFASYAE